MSFDVSRYSALPPNDSRIFMSDHLSGVASGELPPTRFGDLLPEFEAALAPYTAQLQARYPGASPQVLMPPRYVPRDAAKDFIATMGGERGLHDRPLTKLRLDRHATLLELSDGLVGHDANLTADPVVFADSPYATMSNHPLADDENRYYRNDCSVAAAVMAYNGAAERMADVGQVSALFLQQYGTFTLDDRSLLAAFVGESFGAPDAPTNIVLPFCGYSLGRLETVVDKLEERWPEADIRCIASLQTGVRTQESIWHQVLVESIDPPGPGSMVVVDDPQPEIGGQGIELSRAEFLRRWMFTYGTGSLIVTMPTSEGL